MEEKNKESPLGEVKEGTQKVEGKPEKMVKRLLKKMLIRKMSKC